MGVLYILLSPVICSLAVAGLLAQDFPAAYTQYPDLCPSSPCRVQTLLSWLKSGKRAYPMCRQKYETCCLFLSVQLASACLCSASSVLLLLDTEVVLYQLIALFFINNCMNGEWKIMSVRSCLFTTVTVFNAVITLSDTQRDSVRVNDRVCVFIPF